MKKLLVTGGTGSFGKAFLKNIVEKYPQVSRVVIYSRDELKQYELRQMYPSVKVSSVKVFLR